MVGLLRWEGFEDAKRYFAGLGREMLDAATPTTVLHANIVATVLRQVYPLGPAGRIFIGRRRRSRGQVGVPIVPGGLRRGVEVEIRSPHNPAGARTDVINRAKHAWIFEDGTRQRYSRHGNRGTMPASHLFVKTVIRQRQQMETDLARIAEQKGLTVKVVA